MIKPEFVFGGLKAVFYGPAMAFDIDERHDGCSSGTPCGEVGEVAIGNIAPDQQAARPQAVVFIVVLFRFKISQFEVTPIMQPRAFGSGAGRETLPIG